MTASLPMKTAAFCRELAGTDLADLARRHGAGDHFDRAVSALHDGRSSAGLEADLDVLEALAVREFGEGFYPANVLAYRPLPGERQQSGAQWWSCPAGLCAGRGRVMPGQGPAPVCAGRGTSLVARAIDE
ncbi:hypothetical protein [Streptomyces sp. NPDC007007]|uniref:hypothetical protein n=1 Tax=Streptomyces sp. NPDC007007 TaxID=3364770 RepID=UPI0036B34C1A